MSDAVGVKERRNSPLGAPDFGIVVHDFMQELVNGGQYDCSREAVTRLIDGALAKKGIRVDDAARARLIDDAVDYATANVAAIEAGEYRPKYTEYAFTLKTPLGKDKSTDFFGIIDRLDVCGDRARIIDYKRATKNSACAIVLTVAICSCRCTRRRRRNWARTLRACSTRLFRRGTTRKIRTGDWTGV